MVTSFVRHHVRDYDAWRKVYDGFGDAQNAGGVTDQAVYCLSDDRNDVLVMHRFGSADQATAFFASAELRAAMAEAGVDGEPRIEIFDEMN